MDIAKYTQSLIDLGLTLNEARLYLCLLQFGEVTSSTLAKQAKLSRQEVYRVLTELSNRGLVEKVLGSPSKHKAIPINDGITSLIKEKIGELEKAKERTADLVKELSNISRQNVTENEFKFLLISGRNVVQAKRVKMLEAAEQKIRLITTANRFDKGVEYFRESYEKALKKKAIVQIIVEQPKIKQSVAPGIKKLSRFETFEARFVANSQTNLLIIDNKEAVVTLLPSLDLGESTILWTNHPALLDIYDCYFESLWQNSEKQLFAQM